MSRHLDNEAFARHVQRLLAGRGYGVGAIDGHAGARTRAAFDAFVQAIPQPAKADPVAGGFAFPPVGRRIDGVIVHCSATRPDWMAGATTAAKVAEIRRWHVQGNGWRDIGYHHVIDRDGTIAAGRPLEQAGAHTVGRNGGTIGVCLIGGFGSAATDPFGANFTTAQDAALRGYLAAAVAAFGDLSITGHNQWAAKACPGFNVPKWLSERA